MPGYNLRPVQQSDIPALSDLLYASKLALTINRLLFKDWPNEDVQRKNYSSVFDDLDPSKEESVTVADNDSGEVIGYLALNRRRAASNNEGKSTKAPSNDDAKAKERIGIQDSFNAEVLAAVGAAVTELTADRKYIDHYEVTYLVVKPGHRRQGIGRVLIEHALEKAEAAGVPVMVSAEPQIYAFFVHYGFKHVKHVDFNLTKWAPPYSGFGVFRLAALIWNGP